MKIRQATIDEYEVVWEIFHRVIKTGDTYVYAPDTKKTQLKQLWFASNMKTFVAEVEGEVLGTYFLKPNQIDLGSHIANAGFMVHPKTYGKGIGKAMCKDSLLRAKELGYQAMQFNFVVSSNKNAIKLWEDFGFVIVGTIPRAFNHKRLGYVDAHIMYKTL